MDVRLRSCPVPAASELLAVSLPAFAAAALRSLSSLRMVSSQRYQTRMVAAGQREPCQSSSCSRVDEGSHPVALSHSLFEERGSGISYPQRRAFPDRSAEEVHAYWSRSEGDTKDIGQRREKNDGCDGWAQVAEIHG